MLGGGAILGGGGGGIKSIQRGTVTLTGVGSNTATITAVDPTNSILRWLGASHSTGTTTDGLARIDLTNATTVTATRQGTGGNLVVSFEVIEYYPGVIKSVQRGTITLATVTSNTATITSVDTTKATLEMLGWNTNDTANNPTNWDVRIVLTNATTITGTMGTASATVGLGYQVVEWF